MALAKIREESPFYAFRNWAMYGFFLLIAFLTVMLSFELGSSFSAIIIVASIALAVALLCFVRIEIGFYILIALGFLQASANRLLADRYPITSMVLLIPYALIGIVFYKGMQKKDLTWVIPWHPVLCMYFLITGYLIVQLFNPNMGSLLGWFSSFWQDISYMLLLFLSCYIFSDLRRIRFFFKFMLSIIFVTALYGCIQQWFGLSFYDSRWVNSDPHIRGLFSLPNGGLRKFSFLTDPANYGTLMAGGAVASLILLIRRPYGKWNKRVLGTFSFVIILGMSYSGTRTANIMIFAGIGLYILLTLYQKRTQILAVVALVVFAFILYAPIHSNVTLNRFRSAFYASDDPSMNVRLVHRKMLQPYMHSHPFGGGVNTVGGPGAKYNPDHFLAGFPPDGAYFGTALNVGWVGLALECIFYFIVLVYCVHYFYKCRNKEIKTYYAVMAAMLFSLFLGAYAQFTVSSVPQSLLFTAMLAIIIKLHTFDTPELSKTNL